MDRVVIVNTRHDSLAASLMKLLPDAVAMSSFNFEMEEGNVICWLPAAFDPVDDSVNALAKLVDKSVMQPSRIVMLSIAGTADDADESLLRQWYGRNALGNVMAFQYAIKMIDELELPYTVVRTAPLVEQTSGDQVIITAEGQKMPDHHLSVKQLADNLKLIIENGTYKNQSIGLTVR